MPSTSRAATAASLHGFEAGRHWHAFHNHVIEAAFRLSQHGKIDVAALLNDIERRNRHRRMEILGDIGDLLPRTSPPPPSSEETQ